MSKAQNVLEKDLVRLPRELEKLLVEFAPVDPADHSPEWDQRFHMVAFDLGFCCRQWELMQAVVENAPSERAAGRARKAYAVLLEYAESRRDPTVGSEQDPLINLKRVANELPELRLDIDRPPSRRGQRLDPLQFMIAQLAARSLMHAGWPVGETRNGFFERVLKVIFQQTGDNSLRRLMRWSISYARKQPRGSPIYPELRGNRP